MKTKEEILETKFKYQSCIHPYGLSKDLILKAMEEYAEQFKTQQTEANVNTKYHPDDFVLVRDNSGSKCDGCFFVLKSGSCSIPSNLNFDCRCDYVYKRKDNK